MIYKSQLSFMCSIVAYVHISRKCTHATRVSEFSKTLQDGKTANI